MVVEIIRSANNSASGGAVSKQSGNGANPDKNFKNKEGKVEINETSGWVVGLKTLWILMHGQHCLITFSYDTEGREGAQTCVSSPET